MPRVLTSARISLIGFARGWVERYSRYWPDGIAVLIAGVTFAALTVQIQERFPAFPFALSVAMVACGTFCGLLGLYLLWARFSNLRRESDHITAVTVASIGFYFWFFVLLVVSGAGFMFALYGASWPAASVSAFSAVFLAVGGMAGRPDQGWPLRSLLMLKRISNWQLAAASAAIALLFSAPDDADPLLNTRSNLGGHDWPMILLFGWVISAGLLTVLLEPLKYKLEDLHDQQTLERQDRTTA